MMSQYDYDLICIGSGPAGQRCAVQAAKLGKKVALIEKRRCVGGVCLETGTIPSKTFREAVRSFGSQQGLDHGISLSPKARPTIEQLLGRVGRVIERESQVQIHQLHRNDIDVMLGAARFEDEHTITIEADSGSRTLTGEHFMIAIGTQPARPRGVQPDGMTIIDSDGIMNLKKLPQTMAVVGAGVIGIEYATMFASLGVEVTVIDKRTRPLEFLDHELVDELIYQMRRAEITLRLGEGVESLDIVYNPQPQGMIELDSGKHIVADVVLYSAGRVGATDKVNAAAAGLTADDRGRLKVDDQFRTEVPHIFAAGDVIGFPSLAATSAEQGRLAACHMFDVAAEKMSPHFPFGIYAMPEISMVGATEQELTAQKVPYETGIARYREIARGQILGDDSGLFKMIFHRDTRKLLGVHCIGTGATELVHVGQAVLALDGGLDYFLSTIFNYPTLAECYKVAALNAANKLKRLRFVSSPASVAV
ncbi:Si-specific NAD(P)(+) transhydrogenase [Planctomycetales bacterium ZRK34]|nr:Si-specific NAD(P)(+) transhydrogenase [Planctomycetales bacterium ZRK34]